MKISLIITTYNWIEALRLVLESVKQQTILPDEVIIADDGSNLLTKEFIISYSKNYPIKLKHIWQEDKGFRAGLIRNKAIYNAQGEYIIGIDGDLILHKNFIEDHIKNSKKNRYIQGTRVLLDKEKSQQVLVQNIINFRWYEKGLKNRKNAIHSNILSKIFSYKSKNLKGIRSCNFSLYKEDIEKVNGFCNNFTKWGREDSEFVARLLNNNVEIFHLKFNAISYHLYHNERKGDLAENDLILQNTIKNKIKYCKNGLKESMNLR